MDVKCTGVVIAVIFTVTQCQVKVDMTECNNGWLSIAEGKAQSIGCTGLPGNNVKWTVRKFNTTEERLLGICKVDETICDYDSDKGYGLSRVAIGESVLTIHGKGSEIFNDATVKCDGDSDFAACNIRLLHSSVVSSPRTVQSAQMTTDPNHPTPPRGVSSTSDSQSGGNHTSDLQWVTEKTPSQPQTSDSGDSLPVGAIGGGVAAAVVLIIVVVVVIIVWKRRSGSKKDRSAANNADPDGHHNIAYEPENSPYGVSDGYQPAAGKSKAQKQIAVATVDPTYEDSNLAIQDDEPGYASPDNRHPSAGYTAQASGTGFQADTVPSMDDGLYTSVDNPTPGDLAAAPESSTHGDEYAVVDKSKKINKQSYSQPKPAASGELYAQVNKSRPAPGGDIYAQDDKSSKRATSKPTRQNNVAETEDGNYAEVQKPKPDLKPKPALKPKPTCAVKPSPRDSPGPVKTSGGDDEYNVLTFQGRNSDTPANPDAEQLYSHIGSEI